MSENFITQLLKHSIKGVFLIVFLVLSYAFTKIEKNETKNRLQDYDTTNLEKDVLLLQDDQEEILNSLNKIINNQEDFREMFHELDKKID